LALILGLQSFFSTLQKNSVPSFVILDQPSQVYFPSAKKVVDEKGGVTYVPQGEDLNEVKKIFLTISKFVNDHANKAQVIILDHAGEDVWGDIKNIHLAGSWRDGRKLVPVEWITQG
jgi:hypothetical protein